MKITDISNKTILKAGLLVLTIFVLYFFFTVGIASAQNTILTIDKIGRNLSSGNLNWQKTVYASPLDVLSFSLTIRTNGNQSVNNVILRDILPFGLTYYNNLTIDGIANSGDISSEINLGAMTQAQTKIIVYQAKVASSQNFSYGNTTLNNSATVSSNETGNNSATARVTVIVSNSNANVSGATNVSTGFTNDFFIDSFFLPLLITFLVIWLFRSGIFGINQWLDAKRIKQTNYKAQKKLRFKIAKIKEKENLN